jgi:alpha-mannosidase
MILTAVAFTFIMTTFLSTAAFAIDLSKDKTIYTVSNAHLDTQWNWDVRTTINSYIPKTLNNNFALFEKYPDYQFNFEGAFRYALAKEYYPAEYEKMKAYIDQGKWNVTGSSWDAGDVNVPSPEALMRNILYGNGYFKDEFGKSSVDIFLPDCFGFGYALPSVANHMGLKGFSTQKLTWGSANGIPFDIGRWYGVDGSYLISALNPESYTTSYGSSLSAQGSKWVNRVNNNGGYGVYAAYTYHGTGDTGGSPSDGSVKVVQDDINKGLDPETNVKVLSAPADQIFRDITPEQAEGLPLWDDELVMSTHAVGGYTSRAISKRWNRQNELLADATERASVMADWLGGAPYPKEKLDEAWKRFVWHQFHDDIPGTSVPSAYVISWNDYILSLNQFASELTNGVGAISNAMDTSAEGVPVVVYNPISKPRKDVAEAKIDFAKSPKAIRVYDDKGCEVPSQLVAVNGNTAEILFLADMPSVGYKVYDVRSTEESCQMQTGLTITDSTLENNYYKVTIDSNGDIASIIDKINDKELLSAPSRLELLKDNSTSWPSWEILYNDVNSSPKAYVEGPAEVEIVENGPARIGLKVKRTYQGSTFTQIIRLYSGDDAQRIDVDNNVDWSLKATNLKVAFPLTVSNTKATYDLGLGTIERGNNTSKLYEVPAQQWADITDESGEYGVSILNDCKYGWDKPRDNTLRLTLIHTPLGAYGNNKQDVQDFGENRFLYSIYGHKNDWVNGQTVTQGEKVNQPLKAFQTVNHEGSLGKNFSFLSVNNPNVTIKAVKLAEKSDEYIVRVQETSGKPISGVTLSIGNGIENAREVNGAEDSKGSATVEDGKLKFDIKKYEPKTFALKLKDPTQKTDSPSSKAVDLPYNKDVVSFDSKRTDGAIDTLGRSIPGELFPERILSGGISFNMGSKENGENNAVACSGQEIIIPEGYRQVYLLAASTAGDVVDTFKAGDTELNVKIQDYRQNIGQWDLMSAPTFAYIKQDPVAWAATHTHTEKSNSAYDFTYLFKYKIDLPEGQNTITLPDNSDILVFAMTASDNANDDTKAATALYDEKEPGELAELKVINGTGSGLYPAGSIVPVSATIPSGFLFKKWEGPVADPSSTNTTVKVPEGGITIEAGLVQLGPNLTLDKTATANAYINSNESPKHAVDGDGKTKWCDVTTGNKWLVVDLGAEYDINRWIVRHAGSGGENSAWNTRDFRLDVSLDGTNWSTADTVTGNTLDMTNRILQPTKARYVRLYITSAASSGTTARVYEFEVYDKPEVEVTNLTVENGIGSGKFETGSIVPIKATIPCGYLFKEWEGANVLDKKSPNTHIELTKGDLTVKALLIDLGEDLARNKPVSATSYVNDKEKPEFAVDGDIKTKWCTTELGNHWMIVDLGKECSINKWVVRHSGAGGENTNNYWNTKDFRLDVSLDGENWTIADEVKDNDKDITARDFKPALARYARLYITDPTTQVGNHIRIYSFELYNFKNEGVSLDTASISVENTDIERTNTENIIVNAKMSDGSNADLSGALTEYFSNDPSIASVDKDGVIKAKKVGKTQVYATVDMGGVKVISNLVEINVIKAKAKNVQFKFEAEKEITEINEDNIITIGIKDAKDLYAFDFKVNYDSELFEVKEVRLNNEFTSGKEGFLNWADENGNLHILGSLLGDIKGVDGEKKLIDLVFKSKGGQGRASFKLSKDSIASDSDLVPYAMDGDIINKAPVADSDVTGEGTSIESIVAVAKAFNLSEGEEGYKASLDMNKDGIIDIVDIAYVANRIIYMGKSDAYLRVIEIDGEVLAEFNKDVFEYTIKLAPDTKNVPTVAAEANFTFANALVTQADEIPGEAVITVKSQNGTEKIYKVRFIYEEVEPEEPKEVVEEPKEIVEEPEKPIEAIENITIDVVINK